MSVECNTAACDSRNATPPAPAIAPGIEAVDAMRAAERIAARGMDPRVTALVPAFDAPFFQAGLCGYSDAAMRIVARRHGCPFCVTEALLDRTLLAGGRGFAKADLGEIEDNVPGGDEDHPLAGQIMGSDPREMAAAALKMVEQGTRPPKDYRRLAYLVNGRVPATESAKLKAQSANGSGEAAQGGGDPGASVNGDAAANGSKRIHLRLPGGDQIGWYDPMEHLEEECAERKAQRANGNQEAGQTDLRFALCVLRFPSPRSFSTIDVNLACPVKKIDRKARGGHWLADSAGAIAILEAVREAVPASVPCTVKLRRSYDDTPEMAASFERILDAAFRIGYAWATVHGRTVEQKYVGPSRWDILRDIVRRHPDKVIFGSGDVWEAADIFRMVEYTGVSAAAVARGCIGNPWIFRQARRMMAGEPPAPPGLDEQRAVLEEHFRLALAVNGGRATDPGLSGVGAGPGPASPQTVPKRELFTARSMRKFGIRFAQFHPRAEEVRRRFIAVGSLADWRGVLEEFYGSEASECRPSATIST